ncbi:MAG TPA: c-type cytochrome [Usitatibacter sp.]|jgi:cytochrome c553|nr:c-type cytochrome [Usitatibacter sp.]
MKTAAALLLLTLLAIPLALAAQQAGVTQQCAACHGSRGEGNPAMNAPRLAGQNAAYLERQLDAYANGARRNAVMEPIAKGLDAQQRREAAAHYASVNAPPAKASTAAPARGRTLAATGDEKLRVQACDNCHGPQGIGEPPVPYLAGQQQKYLLAALQEWKSGARSSDPSGQMPAIGHRLADADVNALARYFASLPPPAAGQLAANGPPRVTGATSGGGPRGTTSPQGVGIEEGSPTTGGSQGGGGAGGSNTGDPSGTRGAQQPPGGSPR